MRVRMLSAHRVVRLGETIESDVILSKNVK